MEELLNYMLKAGVCLSLFYLIYRFLLSHDTFFAINRYFLILTSFSALLIPALTFSSNANEEVLYYGTIQTIIITADNIESAFKAGFSFWEIAGIIYITGLAIFFIRFMVQMIQLLALINKNGIKTMVHPYNEYKLQKNGSSLQ